MPKYSYYDAAERVIFTDATSLTHATASQIDEIFDDLIALTRTLPTKVYVVTCWRGSGFADAAAAARFGERSPELLRYIRGIVRYGADDPLTRSQVRAQLLKHQAEGTRSNLFETRAEALAAVRAVEQANAAKRK